MKIFPARSINGDITVPGDKSISHRAALLGAVARGSTVVKNFSSSQDCASTLNCLQDLGVSMDVSGSDVTISGVGDNGLRPAPGVLECGNSGTTMRLLAGILAGYPLRSELTGDQSLRRRPMGRIIEPLQQMGAKIDSSGMCAPLRIEGRDELRAIEFFAKTPSAQVKSTILLAGLRASGVTSVIEPTPTRDHTERMFGPFGIEVDVDAVNDGTKITLRGPQMPHGTEIGVPGDISSAAFLIAAAAGCENSRLRINGVGLNPSRTAILEVLEKMGVCLQITNRRDLGNEPVGDIEITGSASGRSSGPLVLTDKIVAGLIDEIPILAVLSTQLGDGLEIRDAAELRVKESDRIRAVVTNLRKMGAAVEEFPDGLRVGRSNLKGATLDSNGDHRIAMAFGVASLFADGETAITGAESADISYPGFFDVLANLATK